MCPKSTKCGSLAISGNIRMIYIEISMWGFEDIEMVI
jgi:hypothetical protein